MYFSLKFNVWLKWMDTRLHYHNLNSNQFLNVIPKDLTKDLWTPLLVFENNKERHILTFDERSSVLMLVGNGLARQNPFYQPDEARVFKSSQTEIHWWSVHLKKFRCHFKLHYFPFDQQSCYVQVRKLQQKIYSIQRADSV